MIGILLALCFLAANIWFTWRNPRRGAFVAFATLPWAGLEVDAGVRVSAFMLSLLALGVAILSGQSRGERTTGDWDALRVFHPYFAVTLIWSLAMLLFLPDAEVAGGALRSPAVRAILQIFVFALTVSPLFLLPKSLRKTAEILEAGKVYVTSCLALSALGFLQIGIWYTTGKDPLPIGILNQWVGGVNAEFIKSGIFVFDGQSLYRMSSLGGEPKVLGQSLGVAAFLVQLQWLLGTAPITPLRLFTWVFLVAAMCLTQSTSAIYIFVLMAVASLYILLTSRSSRAMQLGLTTGATVSLSVALIALCIIAAGAPAVSRASDWVSNLIEARTVGRQTVFEDFDQAILGYFEDNPSTALVGVGLGNIHLFSEKYLPAITRYYAAGKVFFAKSGYLKMIAESGIIGLVLFLYACFRMNARLGTLFAKAIGAARAHPLQRQLGFTFLLLLACYLARIYTTSHFFMVAGTVAATCALLEKTIRHRQLANEQHFHVAGQFRGEGSRRWTPSGSHPEPRWHPATR